MLQLPRLMNGQVAEQWWWWWWRCVSVGNVAMWEMTDVIVIVVVTVTDPPQCLLQADWIVAERIAVVVVRDN